MTNRLVHRPGLPQGTWTPVVSTLAILLFLFASCATTSQGPLGSRDNPFGKHVELTDLRSAIAGGVSDPARKQSLLATVAETESRLAESNRINDKAGGKVSDLMANHKKTKADIVSQMNAWDQEEQPVTDAITKLVFKMKSNMTREEWSRIYDVMIKSILTHSDRFNVQRGA